MLIIASNLAGTALNRVRTSKFKQSYKKCSSKLFACNYLCGLHSIMNLYLVWSTHTHTHNSVADFRPKLDLGLTSLSSIYIAFELHLALASYKLPVQNAFESAMSQLLARFG